MPRALTVKRTTVTPADEPRYLVACKAEADRFRAEGDHLWLFRHRSEPGVFLEFRESRNPERLAAVDPGLELWAEVELV